MNALKSLLWKSLQILVVALFWLAIATHPAVAQNNPSPPNPAADASPQSPDESPKVQPKAPNPQLQPPASPEKEVRTPLTPPRKGPSLYDYEALDKFNADLFGEGVGN